MIFNYVALTPQGKQQRGKVEAENSRLVREILLQQQLTPLKILSAQSAEQIQGKGFNRRKLNAANRALFTRQMATLVQAGLPLVDALTAVAQQSEANSVKHTVNLLAQKVSEGRSLANSLTEFPRAFPNLYIATVRAGEHSGYLAKVMEHLADYTEMAQESRQKITLALLYPAILMLLAVVIVIALMAFVVPGVVEVFAGQNETLPLMTQLLIASSDFLREYWWLLLLTLLIVSLLARTLLAQAAIEYQWHKFLLKIPLISKVIRLQNTARLSSTLHILTSSGVALVDALSIAAAVVGNIFLRDQLLLATKMVSEGSSLHRALNSSGYFPPLMVHMIASGESSGELDTMLKRVAQHQQRELNAVIATVLGIFEPMMLLLMGAIVLFIVLAILQPIFDINTLL